MTNVRMCMLIAVAILAAAACEPGDLTSPSRPDATSEMPADALANAKPVAIDIADVVASVDLVQGGVVTFLDLGDGHIGIAERAPRHMPFVSLRMIEDLDATPLEVYLALQPRTTGVPAPLLRDHQMRAGRARTATATPRALAALQPTASGLQDPGYEFYACDSFGDEWIEDWTNAFAGITKYRAAIYRHQQAGAFLFYPGAPVYYGTNTNSKTYLGACNGDAYDDLVMEVHRRIGGQWVKVYEATIDSYEKYTFYSGVSASYRGRTQGAGASVVEHYGVGAAWTLSPPVAIAH